MGTRRYTSEEYKSGIIDLHGVGGHPLITVFTPTWNRAHLLSRAFDSLLIQSKKNFEWIIYDDGSTDETEQVVRGWLDRADFRIHYIKSKNRGKAAAMNAGAELANGELFLVLDSDDAASSNAMEKFDQVWRDLADTGLRDRYAGMSALKATFDGVLVGDGYELLERAQASYIERSNLGVAGDKWEIIRTDLVRAHPYPLASGERYMAPSYSWLVIARHHLTAFINEPLGLIEYQADGISANNIRNRVNSPVSTYRYYSEFYGDRRFRFRCRLNFTANMNRFALHGGGKLVVWDFMALVLLPVSCAFYLIDRFRLRSILGPK
ncbi:glycosyltransferase family A protein [Luteimonas sp. MJ250]|uniref:glycosyltransferase family A protein n=1 Tax=Luteimonas sp. MJ250 TaxID=3129236 RepID=UPI0031BA1FC4